MMLHEWIMSLSCCSKSNKVLCLFFFSLLSCASWFEYYVLLTFPCILLCEIAILKQFLITNAVAKRWISLQLETSSQKNVTTFYFNSLRKVTTNKSQLLKIRYALCCWTQNHVNCSHRRMPVIIVSWIQFIFTIFHYLFF